MATEILLAKGRDGVVYLSQDRQTVRKVFKSKTKAKREVDALTKLESTGIVPVLKDFDHDKCVSTSFIDGEPLYDYHANLSQKKEIAPIKLQDAMISIFQHLQRNNVDPRDDNLCNYIINEDKDAVFRIDFADSKWFPPQVSITHISHLHKTFPKYITFLLDVLYETNPDDPFLSSPLVASISYWKKNRNNKEYESEDESESEESESEESESEESDDNDCKSAYTSPVETRLTKCSTWQEFVKMHTKGRKFSSRVEYTDFMKDLGARYRKTKNK